MAGRDRDGSSARMRRRLGTTAVVTAAILALGASSALATGFQPAPQTIAAREASAFSGQVAQFTTDPESTGMIASPGTTLCVDSSSVGNVYAATIDWGDGYTSAGTLSLLSSQTSGMPPAVSSCTYGVTGSHTYTEDGTRPVTVHVTSLIPPNPICIVMPTMPCTSYGPGGDIDSTANLADAPITGTTGGVNATQGVPFAGVVAAFTDADGDAPLRDYSATINWGDGTSSAGTFSPNADGSVSVFGDHTYAQSGSFPLSVAIHDAGGAGTTPSGTANVAAAPTPAATSAPSKTKPKAKPRSLCAKGKHRVGRGKRAHCVKNKARHKGKAKGRKH